MWRRLDERASRLDIDDVSERWAQGLVEHPFPSRCSPSSSTGATTVECDLASEEAPMHCDICTKAITALLYLEE